VSHRKFKKIHMKLTKNCQFSQYNYAFWGLYFLSIREKSTAFCRVKDVFTAKKISDSRV